MVGPIDNCREVIPVDFESVGNLLGAEGTVSSIMPTLWEEMNARPRRSGSSLMSADVPKTVGVYAWYRDGLAIYAGRAVGAKGLNERVWKNHLANGPDLSRSSFRRNVCDHLGIANTAVSRIRPTRLSATDVEPINAWIRDCEVAWIEFDSVEEAKGYELDLLAEWMPLLSRK